MAKKPLKWITTERLQVLNEEFELHSTKRSFTKACQAVAIRLGITSSAVYYAYNNLIKHFGYIPITTPEYSLIKKKKPVKEKLPRKQRARKTNCITCSVLLTEENRGKTTRTFCRTCYNSYMRDYTKKNIDKHREITYSWRKRNKDKVHQMNVQLAIKKFGSFNNSSSFYCKKSKDALTDGYVRSCLINPNDGLKRKELPNNLIELKRKQLFLIRQLKQYGK